WDVRLSPARDAPRPVPGAAGVHDPRDPLLPEVRRMAGPGWGVWVPSYSWAESGPEHVERLRRSIQKCEEHGFDVWVIDHLLSAPGLYGTAWLEPLGVLTYAAGLTSRVKLATGILVLPVRHPVVLA